MDIGLAILMNEDLEKRMRWAKKEGFSYCQLQLWDMNQIAEKYAVKTQALIKEVGLNVISLWCGWHGPIRWDFESGPDMLGIVPSAYRATRTQNLLDGAAYARILGVKDIVTHLGFVPTSSTAPEYIGTVNALRFITDELKKHGQNFLMETGQEPPVVLKRLIEDVGADNLFINYDPANLMMYGNSHPIDGLELLHPYIRNVHIKDGDYPTGGYNLGLERPIGKGSVNIPLFLKKIKEFDFDGPFFIEHEISVENESEQLRDILEGKRFVEGLT